MRPSGRLDALQQPLDPTSSSTTTFAWPTTQRSDPTLRSRSGDAPHRRATLAQAHAEASKGVLRGLGAMRYAARSRDPLTIVNSSRCRPHCVFGAVRVGERWGSAAPGFDTTCVGETEGDWRPGSQRGREPYGTRSCLAVLGHFVADASRQTRHHRRLRARARSRCGVLISTTRRTRSRARWYRGSRRSRSRSPIALHSRCSTIRPRASLSFAASHCNSTSGGSE